MSRTPDFTPQLVEGLLPQIVAILQRDLAANLAIANAASSYAPVGDAAYNTTDKGMYENPPEIVVEPLRTVFDEDEQLALTAQHTLAVSAVVVGDDTETLARQARDYARAMVMSLARSEDLADYHESLPITLPDGTASATAGFAPGTILEVSVKSVDWALKAPQGALFARQPIVELQITAVEQ